MRTDRQTDRHDKAIKEASEKAICFETLTAIFDQFMVFFLVSEPCSRQMLPLIVRTLVYSKSRNPKEHHQMIKGPRLDIWLNSPRSTTIISRKQNPVYYDVSTLSYWYHCRLTCGNKSGLSYNSTHYDFKTVAHWVCRAL